MRAGILDGMQSDALFCEDAAPEMPCIDAAFAMVEGLSCRKARSSFRFGPASCTCREAVPPAVQMQHVADLPTTRAPLASAPAAAAVSEAVAAEAAEAVGAVEAVEAVPGVGAEVEEAGPTVPGTEASVNPTSGSGGRGKKRPPRKSASAEPRQSQRSSRATAAAAPFGCDAVLTALRAALAQQPQGVPVDLDFGTGKLGQLIAIRPVKDGVEVCEVVYDDYKSRGRRAITEVPLTKLRVRST